MKKIIALALITSFAATGVAMAQVGANSSSGGNGGGNEAGDNNSAPQAVQPVVIKKLKRRPVYRRIVTQYCHTGGDIAASDNECSHYSR